MSRIGFVKLLPLVVLTLGTTELWATVTYQVGTCKPAPHTFPTITAALTATPPPNIVKVCPGTYPEQVLITQAVILEGMISGNSGEVIIASPPNGLVVNATDDLGDPIAAQVFVETNPGPVQINDITLDAANNEVQSPAYVVGIFFQNSSGTVNHVATRNQMGGAGGVGAWIEGGLLLPAVTVENSSIRSFDDIGTWVQTNAAASELTVTIKDNDINGGFGSGVIANVDIAVGPGATSTVSDNNLAGGATGVRAAASANGSISGNRLFNNGTAIAINGGGVSVTSNNIFLSSVEGIVLDSALLPAIRGNTIAGCPIGIELNGFADGDVHSNTIMDGGVGLDQVPAGFAASNFYYNVGTIINVQTPSIQLPAAISVVDGQTVDLTLSLSAPAPPGGLHVDLASSNPTVATVPASVNVSGQSATVSVTGVSVGSATITASASGYTSAFTSVTVSPN
jgi:hypothetical protein